MRRAGGFSLYRGRVWAELKHGSIRIDTPLGRATNLGTSFGLHVHESGRNQASGQLLDVDVRKGRVKFVVEQPGGVGWARELEAGSGLTVVEGDWVPEERDAELGAYVAGLRVPVGLAFVQGPNEMIRIAESAPLGGRWLLESRPVGEGRAPGASFRFAWAGSHFYSAGSAASGEAALYRTHLVGAYFEDGARERVRVTAAAAGLDFQTDDGVVIELRGMHEWMRETGASGYRVSLLRNSRVDGVRFLPVRVHDGRHGSGSLLEILESPSEANLPAGHPDGAGETGSRGFGEFSSVFDSDVLSFSLEPQQEEISIHRNNVSAVLVTPVFPN